MSSRGVKYFPLDVCIDSKLEAIENEFGIKGFAVVVKLFQRIYGQEGYYCEWNDEVMLSFATRTCLLGGSIVSEIVDSALRRGIFNKEIYERFGVLTSKGIQERYLKITNRRKESVIKKEYLLIKCTQNPDDVDNSSENVDIFNENVDNSSINKTNELNELNKMNKINKKVFQLYAENIGAINSIIAQKLQGWIEDVDVSLIEYAIEQAVTSNAKNFNYIEAILKNNLNAGRKTRVEAENSKKPTKAKKTAFNNFEQPDDDVYDIELMAIKKRMKEQGVV